MKVRIVFEVELPKWLGGGREESPTLDRFHIRWADHSAVREEDIPQDPGGLLGYFDPRDSRWKLVCWAQKGGDVLTKHFGGIKYRSQGHTVVILPEEYGRNAEDQILQSLWDEGYEVDVYG